jgi:ribose transport system substrate-binding protein
VKAQFLAATTAIAIAISGGSAFAAEKKQLYFVPNGAVDFWKLAEAAMKKAQAELPNYAIQIKYPEQSSAAIQNRLMDDLVAGGAAGIMVSAIDPKTQTEALDKVASQAVLATTDSDAPASKRAFYLGSSNVEAGKQAAEVLIKAMPQGGKCIAFAGLPNADNARERLEGIRSSIKDTKITIEDVRGDDMDQTRAKRNVEDMLTARSDIACFIGVYAYNTPQIVQALQAAGKAGQITVVGFDSDQGTLEASAMAPSPGRLSSSPMNGATRA